MKFKVAEDVEAPLSWTWAGFTDFSAVEADIRARDADLERVDGWQVARPGAAWRGSVPVQGRAQPIEARITTFAPEEAIVIESRVGGMACTYEMTLAPLPDGMTRVSIVLELRASTMSARLMLQTLKLARRRAMRRIEGALVRQGQTVERAWAARSSG
ncbi:hypothetical protein P6F26_01540 [Roseibacterium sp. SDUM158017]|uniref:hypothetical protein n=1 Tax=Roseicyclus salinarum TaxID=3036773 RepID=UPI002414D940|nr:hypothetical protein [Roseibacterium sp. SDUM158017]MDG4647114.1 hypothetical protein [Roseibacterium sp. SDUM158017]